MNKERKKKLEYNRRIENLLLVIEAIQQLCLHARLFRRRIKKIYDK